jgi:hypothetical protein
MMLLLKDRSEECRNRNFFGLDDRETLLTVAREAKEWIFAHALKC